MARKLGVALLVLVGVGWIAWRLAGGAAGIAGAALPPFPELPPPVTQLSEADAGTIHYATTTPYDLDVILADLEGALPTTGIGTLTLPEGASAEAPVPAMVLLHGSGGISPGREHEYAPVFAALGIATFVVDYYAPRGIDRETPYMLRVLSVTEFDAVADAYAALRVLATHPRIDGNRIGVMGFSYGGMATRIAMDERVRSTFLPGHPGFAAFVDVYGPCFQQLHTERTNGAPLLTLRGTEDASNELPACAAREEELRALGVDVTAYVYEGAGHAWETQIPRELRPSPYVAGCTLEYDAAGHPSVGGEPISQHPPGTSREARLAARVGSAGAFGDCVGEGYVIGRDEKTHARATADLSSFLVDALRPAP